VGNLRASVAGAVVVAATGWSFGNIGPAADVLRDAYGTGLGMIGLLISAVVLTHTAMNIPAGRMVDAVGAPRIVLAGCAILLLANVVAATSPSLALGIAMRCLAGVGTAMGFVAATDYVRVVTRSPFAQGIVGGAAFGGAGLSLAIVPLLDGLGWRAPYLSAAVVAVIAGAVFSAAPIRGSAPARSGRRPASLASLLNDRGLYRLGVVHVGSMGTSLVVGAWVVTLLTREGDLGTRASGLVGSLVLLLGLVTRPAGGWIRHRRPDRMRAVVQLSLAAVGLATVALSLSPPLPLAILACSVVGIAAGLPFAVAFDAAAALRPEAPAAAVGLVNMLANLFVLVTAPIVGALFGLGWAGQAALAAIGALTALGALIVPSRRGLGLAP